MGQRKARRLQNSQYPVPQTEWDRPESDEPRLPPQAGRPYAGVKARRLKEQKHKLNVKSSCPVAHASPQSWWDAMGPKSAKRLRHLGCISLRSPDLSFLFSFRVPAVYLETKVPLLSGAQTLHVSKSQHSEAPQLEYRREAP